VIRPSRQHLRDTGESYGEHLVFACRVGVLAIGGGLACFAHALVPAIFTSTGSNAIRRLNRMIDERGRKE